MRKLLKLLGIMAAMAMVLGFGFTACSSGDDDDDGPKFDPKPYEQSFADVLKDLEATEEEQAGMIEFFKGEGNVTVENPEIATLTIGEDKFIITPKAKGTTYIQAKDPESGEYENVYKIDVDAKGTVTLTYCGGSEQGGEASLPWTLDFSKFGDAGATSGSKFTLGTHGTIKDETLYSGEWGKYEGGTKAASYGYVDEYLMVCSPSTDGTMTATFEAGSKEGSLNYGGGYGKGFASTAVGSDFAPGSGEELNKSERYIGVDASKFKGVTGNVKVTFTVKTVPSTNSAATDSSIKGQVALVDGNGKILVFEDGFDQHNGGEAKTLTLEATIAKDGKVFLYYSRNGFKYGSINVTKVEAVEDKLPVAVAAVTLSDATKQIAVGADFTLTATVTPDNADDKTVTWASNKSEIATVENGKVTGVAVGEATITATAGEKTATCVVTVYDPNSTVMLTVTVDGESAGDPIPVPKDTPYGLADLCAALELDPADVDSVTTDPAVTPDSDGKYSFSADTAVAITLKLSEGLTLAANDVKDAAVTANGWYQDKANVKANYITENPSGTINVHVENKTDMPTPLYILQNATTANGAVKVSATLNITKAGKDAGIMELLGADGTSIGQGARISAYADNKITLISKGSAESTTKVADIALGSDITVETIINFGAGKFQSKINGTKLDVQKFTVTAGKTDAFKAIKFNPKSSGTDMKISGVSVVDVAEGDIPDDLKPTEYVTVTVNKDSAEFAKLEGIVKGQEYEEKAFKKLILGDKTGIQIDSIKNASDEDVAFPVKFTEDTILTVTTSAVSVTNEDVVVDITALAYATYVKNVPSSQKAAIDEGVELGSDKIVNNGTGNVWYVDSKGTKINAIEIVKKGTASIDLTVTDACTITISASSTGSSNSSELVLKKGETPISESTSKTTVTGSTATDFVYNVSEAGTYKVLSPGSTEDLAKRGARITKITIEY